MSAHLLRKWSQKLSATQICWLVNWYRPFRGAGIRIVRISPDFREIRVLLRMRWWNRNYVGTHFGGSIYAMTDPWYMFLLMQQLGPNFIVWDMEAKVRFLKPGRGTLSASFNLTEDDLARVNSDLQSAPKALFTKEVEILDEREVVVARVEKVVYIRRKA